MSTGQSLTSGVASVSFDQQSLDAEYSLLLQGIAGMVKRVKAGTQLFSVPTVGLYDAYIAELPPVARQYFTCRTCKKFFDEFGGLVVVDGSKTRIKSVVWPELPSSSLVFYSAMKKLREMIELRWISGAFYPQNVLLGVPESPVGVWSHIHANLNSKTKVYSASAADKMRATAHNNHEMLGRHATRFSTADVTRAIDTLFAHNMTTGVYVAVLKNLEWLRGFFSEYETAVSRKVVNHKMPDTCIWAFAASAPEGFCNLGGTVTGAYLEDVSLGKKDAARLLSERMRPTDYKRPKAAPTKGQVEQATRKFLDDGLADSLKRRPALLTEIPLVWRHKTFRRASKSVFGDLSLSGGSAAQVNSRPVSDTKMTWMRFKETVLGQAASLSFYAPLSFTYGAITTAVSNTAPSLFLWGNAFAWYTYSAPQRTVNWGLKPGTEVSVAGIADPPYLWNTASKGNAGERWAGRAFLILAGAADKQFPSAAIFPECLRPDLFQYRKTIEEYCRNNKLASPPPGQRASGLQIEDKTDFPEFRLRVTTESGISYNVTIDRWA